MNRDTGQVALVALVCILALGFTAATINTTVDTQRGSASAIGDIRNQSGLDLGGGFERNTSRPANVSRGGDDQANAGFDTYLCTPFVSSPGFLVLSLGGMFVGTWLVGRRYGGDQDRTVMGVIFLAFLPFFILALVVFSTCGGSLSPQGPGGGNVSAPAPPGGEGGVAEMLTSPPIVALVFGVLAIGLVIGFVALGSGRPGDAGEEEAPPEEDSLEAIGDAAGRAAERIEADADVDNEVYEAWKEMTTHLDVDQPESSTPGEFAAAAVDAGMAREDVEELTRLFEEVRYGGADPAGREQRAAEALRRIEAAYGGEDG